MDEESAAGDRVGVFRGSVTSDSHTSTFPRKRPSPFIVQTIVIININLIVASFITVVSFQ